jgi:CHAT domain-containing protein/Flp pilus assembly protein TadD
MSTDSNMKHCILILIFFGAASISVAQSKLDQINNLLIDANYTEAVSMIDRAISQTTDKSAVVLLENKKAEALIRLGRFDEADHVLKLADQQINQTTNASFLQAVIQATEGFLYLNQGRNDRALESLQKSISLFATAGKENGLEAAQALSFLGQAYINTGKYNQAEEQLQMALSLREKESKDSEIIAASYNDLGLVYSFMQNNDRALEYYEKALAIYQKIHGNEHPKIAIANTNIGVIYRNMELYGDAINDFEASLKIWDKVYSKPHPSKAFVLSNLAQTYSKMSDQKAALGFYERALTMYEESYGKKHPDVARVLNTIGNIKLASRNYTGALANYQEALKANITDFESSNVKINPSLKNFYNGNVLLYSLLLKAQGLEALYYGKTLKFADLLLALQTLHTCDSLIDKLRQQITNESDKISLGVVATEVYGDGVRIAFNAGMNSVHKKRFFEDAFYFAEKSKSAVLLEAISDSDAKSFAGIPKTLLEEEKSLKSAIALCTQKLAQKPSPEEEKYLRETSFSLNRSYETFTKTLEHEYPSYFNLKFNSSSPSIKDIQSLLDTKTTLLSYFIDDKNTRLYIFIISKGKFHIIDHALPADFDKTITGLRNSLFFNDFDVFMKSSQKLSDLLLPAISSSTSDLVILPTGRLGIIPFETLLTHKLNDKQTNYNNLPYLLAKYNVRYEFSAGLLLQKAKAKQHQPAGRALSILLCAPVTFAEKENLSDLPGTESEVKDISALFGEKSFTKELYLKKDANENLVKSDKLKNFELLHFATHGIVDENNPELSRIFLQSNSDAEDGNLYTGEIYNLELNANLVTLSACQTGLGKISKGEGVIGLSRALVYAGAKNVIVSFWSVADESTAELMKDFYKSLLANPAANYGQDLRTAKLNLIKNGKYSAPYYWAPFILIGF